MNKLTGLEAFRGEMQPAVAVRHVTKRYGECTALDDVSFTIAKGDIVGILGPNGAGKSTLLRLLLRLSMPSSGEICVGRHGARAGTAAVARSTGYVAQESMFDYRATPRSELHFQGRLFGMSRMQARARAEDLLGLVGLEALADTRITTLSGGNRRRLDIAMAQLHSPDLIILDEPTQGLDVESRARVWEALEKLNAAGVTIMFSTHDMAEAEQRARRLLIVQDGRILADDKTASICAAHQSDVLILTLDRIENEPALLEAAQCHAQGEPWIADRQLFIPMDDAQKKGLSVAEALRSSGAAIAEFQIKRNSLEAAYLNIAKARFERAGPSLRRAA